MGMLRLINLLVMNYIGDYFMVTQIGNLSNISTGFVAAVLYNHLIILIILKNNACNVRHCIYMVDEHGPNV